MGEILAAVQVLLALAFTVAATGKALLAEPFRGVLRVSGFSERLATVAGAVVPAIELALGLALVFARADALALAFAATAALLAVFVAWQLSVLRRGMRLRCACFGSAARPVSPRSIGRNAALIVVCAAGVVLSRHADSGLPAAGAWTELTAAQVVLLIALAQAFLLARPLLVLTSDDASRRLEGSGG